MSYISCFFAGRGVTYSADILPSGKPGPLTDHGQVTTFRLTMETDAEVINDMRKGHNLPVKRIPLLETAGIELTADEYTLDNLAMNFCGAKVVKAAGTVTGEPLPSGLVAGQRVMLDNPKISSLVIHDSAVTPATLAPGTHYKGDLEEGHVDILDVGSFVQPYKADYGYAGSVKIGAFATPRTEKMFILEGINTADSFRRVRIVVFKVLLDPPQGMDFLSREHATLSMTGTALADLSRPADDPLGYFMSYEYVDA